MGELNASLGVRAITEDLAGPVAIDAGRQIALAHD
jgi:hypothetical protein